MKGTIIMATALKSPGLSPIDKSKLRGFHVMYHPEDTNRCPGCGKTHWYVRRVTAECAFCSTALMIAGDTDSGQGGTIVRINRQGRDARRGSFTENGKA